MSTPSEVARHYGRPSLGVDIMRALEAAGKDIGRLTPDDLAPLDELHTLGRTSTISLARLLALTGRERVLDLGCGIGGPSRYLAWKFGCHVSGIDLTPEFCEVAAMLAGRTGLADKLDYQQGDALSLPYPPESFDVVWSQNIVMNVADRTRLYGEIRRVLRPDGRYGFAEVVAGEGTPYFPLPWAREPSISFLMSAKVSRRQIVAMGFDIKFFEDKTSDVLEQRHAPASHENTPLGMQITMGADAIERMRNARRSYAEGKIRFIQGVATRLPTAGSSV